MEESSGVRGWFRRNRDNSWVPLVILGLALILLAGFDEGPTGVTTWPDFLDLGFLAGGVITLILAALVFGRRNKVSEVEV